MVMATIESFNIWPVISSPTVPHPINVVPGNEVSSPFPMISRSYFVEAKKVMNLGKVFMPFFISANASFDCSFEGIVSIISSPTD
jgi:hypothetical protein